MYVHTVLPHELSAFAPVFQKLGLVAQFLTAVLPSIFDMTQIQWDLVNFTLVKPCRLDCLFTNCTVKEIKWRWRHQTLMQRHILTSSSCGTAIPPGDLFLQGHSASWLEALGV